MNFKELKEMLASVSQEELAKAVSEAYGLTGIRAIQDLWMDMHKVPSAHLVTSGPPLHSSGAGAEHAVKDYSNPAPQVGITREYNEMAEHTLTRLTGADTVGNVDSGPRVGAHKSISDELRNVLPSIVSMLQEIGIKSKKGAKSITPERCWRKLGSLGSDISKAESAPEHFDVDLVSSAKSFISKAERALSKDKDAVTHEATDQAWKFIKKAKKALKKARNLEHFGLTGSGNQADSAIPDTEADSMPTKQLGESGVMLHDLHVGKAKVNVIEAKAMALAARAKRLRADGKIEKAQVVEAKARVNAVRAAKMRMKMAEKKENDKEKEKAYKNNKKSMYRAELDHILAVMDGTEQPKDVTAFKSLADAIITYSQKMSGVSTGSNQAATADAKLETVVDVAPVTAKTEDPNADFRKAVTERVAALEAQFTNRAKTPTIVPIVLKSNGITSENTRKLFSDKIDAALEGGELSEYEAGLARSLVDKYRAAALGNGLDIRMVNQQLDRGPDAVKALFGVLSESSA